MSVDKPKPTDTPAEPPKKAEPKPADPPPPWKTPAWADAVAARCWADKAPYPGIDERLLAIGFEMGQLQRDADRQVKEGSNKTFAYHSIDQVQNSINELQTKYRVRITPSVTGWENLEGGVILKVHWTAYCWHTTEKVEWDWIDDGQDMSKAGAFAVKYGLLRYFAVGDGDIDVAEEIGGKDAIRKKQASSSQARTPAPTNGGGAVDATVKEGLYLLAKTLPANAGWAFKADGSNIKIDAMLKSNMDPNNVRTLLVEAHKKAHGENCEHVAPQGVSDGSGTAEEVGDAATAEKA